MDYYSFLKTPKSGSTSVEEQIITNFDNTHYCTIIYKYKDPNYEPMQRKALGINLNGTKIIRNSSFLKIVINNQLTIFYAKNTATRNNITGTTIYSHELNSKGWFYIADDTIYDIEDAFIRGDSIEIISDIIALGYFTNKTNSVKFPTNLTWIGNDAFRDTDLINVTLSNSIYLIDARAFQGCNSLNSINIPNSVLSIGEEAFKDCINLKYIDYCPIHYVEIFGNAFSGCTSLFDDSSTSPKRGIVNLYCTPSQARSWLGSKDYIKYCKGNFVKKIIVNNIPSKPAKIRAINGSKSKDLTYIGNMPESGGYIWDLN